MIKTTELKLRPKGIEFLRKFNEVTGRKMSSMSYEEFEDTMKRTPQLLEQFNEAVDDACAGGDPVAEGDIGGGMHFIMYPMGPEDEKKFKILRKE